MHAVSTSLVALNLSGNMINFAQGTYPFNSLRFLVNLVKLDLSENLIEGLRYSGVIEMKELKDLDLGGNKIGDIEEIYLLKGNMKLRDLNIAENPLM